MRVLRALKGKKGLIKRVLEGFRVRALRRQEAG